MTGIVSFNGQPVTPEGRIINEDVVTILREALERALNGQTDGVALIERQPDTGTIMSRGGIQCAAMVGRLADLQRRIMNSWPE